MFHKISTILIWSEHHKQLADWYQDVFNLKINEQLNHPQDTGTLFEFPDGLPYLWIGQHSQINGTNKDPMRIMFNINVDSVKQAYDYLKSKHVTCIAPPFKAPTMEKWFATYADPDGNTIQTIGME